MSTLYGMMSGGPQTQESQRVPFSPQWTEQKFSTPVLSPTKLTNSLVATVD
jgi:hypothetical protein